MYILLFRLINTIHLLDDYTNVVILYIVYQMFNYSLLFYPLTSIKLQLH